MKNIMLDIANKDKLKRCNAPHYTFGKFGGTIGSSAECQLAIQDIKDSIAPKHCNIAFSEGNFVLSSLDGEVFYNGAFSALRDDEVIINVGDTIKLGEIEFLCADPDKHDITPLEQELDHIDEFNKLDNLAFTPIGQVDNAKLLEKDAIKDLIDNKNLLDNALPKLSKKDLMNLITQSLIDSNVSLKTPHYKAINISQIEAALEGKQFIESKRLINMLAIGMILKELDSPLLITQGGDIMDYVSNAINDIIEGNKETMEILLIKALKKYIN